jgi:hypothetical protein
MGAHVFGYMESVSARDDEQRVKLRQIVPLQRVSVLACDLHATVTQGRHDANRILGSPVSDDGIPN